MNPAPMTFTFAQLVTILVAAVGGVSVIGAVTATGIWYRFLKDRVRSEIKTFNSEPDSITAFDAAVIRVIDNQINRRDGIIHLEITKQVEESNGKLLSELKKLREDFGIVTEIGAKMSHVEGSLAVIMSALRVTPPPPTPPKE